MPDATIPAPASDDVAGHDQVETFREDVAYPEHAQRTESPLFRKNKIILLRQCGLGCLVCGSKVKLEIHHWACEWAEWGNADTDKLLTEFHRTDYYGFAHSMGDAAVESPDDIRNLWPLCGEFTVDGVTVEGGHDRGVDIGVHHLTMPTFMAQVIAKPGVQITRLEGHHARGQTAATSV